MIDALIKQAQSKIKNYEFVDRFCIITIAKEIPTEIDQTLPPQGIVVIVSEDEADYYYYSNLYNIATQMPTDKLGVDFLFGDVEKPYIREVYLGELSDFTKVFYYNFYKIKGRAMLKSVVNNARKYIKDNDTEIRISVDDGQFRLVVTKDEVDYLKLEKENSFIFSTNKERSDEEYITVFKQDVEDYIEENENIEFKVIK